MARAKVSHCLKAAREKLGLKKVQLADLLGTHESSLSRIENGKRPLSNSLMVFSSIVNGLDIEADEINSLINSMPAEFRSVSTINVALTMLTCSKGRTGTVESISGIKIGAGPSPSIAPSAIQAIVKECISDWSDEHSIQLKMSVFDDLVHELTCSISEAQS